jgi:hypothetical protein
MPANRRGNSLRLFLYQFESIPKNILVVTKPNDQGTLAATKTTIRFLKGEYPNTAIHVEKNMLECLKDSSYNLELLAGMLELMQMVMNDR